MKTALITGASSGIGRELAWIHASRGGNLLLVARREDKLLELKEDIQKKYGVKVFVFVQDLTQENGVDNVLELIEKESLKIDYLINNAGFGGIGAFHERHWESDKKMILLNVLALTEMTRKILPHMLKNQSGKILNISSIASLMPGPLQAVYFATKAYVTSFSNAINEELKGSNITVTTLLPAPTETEFGKISEMDKTPLFNKTASAYKVAKEGYGAMLKGKLNIVSGTTKLLPYFIHFIPNKMILKYVKIKQRISKKESVKK